jgi:hypothetical protein
MCDGAVAVARRVDGVLVVDVWPTLVKEREETGGSTR